MIVINHICLMGNSDQSKMLLVSPFCHWIPETRNLHTFLVSGIQWQKGGLGFFSDQRESQFLRLFNKYRVKILPPSLVSFLSVASSSPVQQQTPWLSLLYQFRSLFNSTKLDSSFGWQCRCHCVWGWGEPALCTAPELLQKATQKKRLVCAIVPP